jgi:hypothetical protein
MFKVLEIDSTTKATPTEIGDGFATREEALAAIKRHLKSFRVSGRNPDENYWWFRDLNGLRRCWIVEGG